MTHKKTIYRRRQSDWQTHMFAYVGLPVLSFADTDGRDLVFEEVVKPRLSATLRATSHGHVQLKEAEVIKAFRETLDGKTGLDLENAAAELLLTSGGKSEASDWEAFNAWVARRAQPLDPRLIEALGRFYACRLNKILEHTLPVRAPYQAQVHAIGPKNNFG